MTKVERWPRTIKRRRLNWLGHVMRLPIDTPARMALNGIYEILQARGRPKNTWMKAIKKI